MKYIIPAKGTSLRVKNKNWRPFHGGMSLVDVMIHKLIAADVDPQDIYVSCEDEDNLDYVRNNWNVKPVVRDFSLCSNTVPLTTWIRQITKQVDPSREHDIAWCQVCDPLFNDYSNCFKRWERAKAGHDSLVVCYPWKGYLMTDQSQPFGWSFGEHHTPSQLLPKFRTMPFTLSILSPEAIESTGYHVGRNPYWFQASKQSVDIDTEQDFAVAQFLFERLA